MSADANEPLPDGILRTKEGVYVLRNDTHLSRWVEEHGRLDIAEPQIAHYAKYIPVGGTVVDAGACIGDHTCTYAKLVGPTGHVIAYEPNLISYLALELNFSKWKTVSVINRGLGENYGHGVLIPSSNAGAGFIIPGGEGGKVRIAPLDGSGIDLLQRLDFIHLDCEGMERSALLGASRLIAKFHPSIVLEINHGCLARYGLVESDVIETLSALCYKWEEIEPGHGPHLPQRDILATPK